MTITTAGRRNATALLLITSLLAGLAALVAAPASATAYRYWSYWQGASGEWVAAQTGPGDHTVTDRDVQGWRFAISTETVTVAPDNSPDFATLCPDLADPADGQVRAAVVIDSGFTADAPQGQTPPADVVACVTVPEGSTGNQALAAAASVTDQQGLVCAINGYPEGECGAAISDADAAAAAEAASTEPATPAVIAEGAEAASDGESRSTFVLGGLAVALLLGAAWALPALRRRSRQNAS